MKNTKDLGTIILPFPNVLKDDFRDAAYLYIVKLKDRRIEELEALLNDKIAEDLGLWNYSKNKYFNKYFFWDQIVVKTFLKSTVIFWLVRTGQPVFKLWELVIIGVSFLW